jgi:tRNA-uridine 2-sulfurtransferase
MANIQKKDSVLVAMSGGVDSSAAALILQKAGYKVKGAILRMHDADMTAEDLINGKLPTSIWYAREVARKLRLDFSIIDIRQEFAEGVMRFFAEQHAIGHEPNPCIYCNSELKLPKMFQVAQDTGCDKVASGHYARIQYDEAAGRYTLRKAKDRSQDQSYMLYNLTQDMLGRLITPLGEYEKSEVREIAAKAGLKNAHVPDSCEVCFVPDGDYSAFVRDRLKMASDMGFIIGEIPGLVPGNIIDRDGKIIGKHDGLVNYVVGRRKGLDDSIPADLCVYRKIARTNELVLAPEEDMYMNTVILENVNYVSIGEIPNGQMRANVKFRYEPQEYPATITAREDGTLELKLDEKVRILAAGRSVTLYDDDLLIAGGFIRETGVL